MSAMLWDAQYALRTMRRNPGFTAVMVLTLAIGIGANTALFSVVDNLLIRPFPYPDSERLVVVWSKPPKGFVSNVSAADFLDFREQNQVFDLMGAVMQADFTVSVQGMAERFAGMRASADFLETLGVRPALGRIFAAGDERPGAPRVAILSYGAWQRRFGSDPAILGSALTVDGAPHTVVGILPASFRFAFLPELLTPLTLDKAVEPRDLPALFVIAKLRRGMPLEQARAQMQSLADNIAKSWPATMRGWSVDLWPWRQNFVGGDQRRVLVLFGAVGLVLLIACVNLANLLLAKAAAHRHELALCAALGADRVRLIRRVLTESVLLSLMGGAAGILLAFWLMPLAAALVWAPVLSAIGDIGIDWRVLSFNLLLSVITGLLFGVLPALRASRVNLSDVLKETGHGLTGRSAGKRFRGALVVAEVALSLMLLVGAGLLIRSLAAMHSDLGFQPENALTMRLTLPEQRYGEPSRTLAFHRLLLERVQTLPGVRAASLSYSVPLEGRAVPMRFEVLSHPVAAAQRPNEAFQYASERYFETLGIALRQGRIFTPRDDESAPRVAVVNEAFVNRYMAKENPVGQRLLLDERWISSNAKPVPPRPWEIVGVVANVKIWGEDRGDTPQIYAPVLQCPRPESVLALNTIVEAAPMARSVREVINGLDKDVPVTDIRTMRQVAEASFAQPRSQT